jgi:hemolysin III
MAFEIAAFEITLTDESTEEVHGANSYRRCARRAAIRSLFFAPVDIPRMTAGRIREPGIIRLSGTDLCPRLRGHVHLGALIVAGPAAVALIVRHPTFDVIVYAVGLIALFAVSSVYHLVALPPPWRRVMRQVDHVTIYVFIAASYTPFCWLAMPRSVGVAVLVVAWLGAIVGVAMKVARFDGARRLGGALYLAIGCLAVLTLPVAFHSLDPVELSLLIGTGVIYGAGAAVLLFRRPDPVPDRFGYHEIWHSAVVLASACYFAFVWQLAR